MRLKPEQLENSLNKKIAPVYLITGDEPLQLGETADLIRKVAKKAGYDTREVFSAETGFEWNELIVAADSLSLFADKKILDLRMPSAKPGTEGAKVLTEYCKRVPDDTLLLITLPKLASASLKTKWIQAIDQVGVIIQIWPLDGAALVQWLQRRAQSRGLQIEQEGIKALASRIEGNLLAASQEIEKLYILHGTAAISKQAVEDAVADSARFDVFKLTDSVLTGRMTRSVKILNGLKAEGLAAPVVVWALAREIRLLINIKTAIEQGQNKEAVFKSFRLWDKRKQIINAALSRLDMQTLHKALLLSGKADRQIKGREQGDYWETLLQLCLLLKAL
ncbi:MAG: DNA polymerase III subunit delta [Methylococcales bacterium]|nr:DNA polymerase III subunit delta [Methylococcales bacterium]